MKRQTWLAGACLLGGLMVAALVSGLRASAQAVGVKSSPVLVLSRRSAAITRAVVINEVAWMGTAAGYTDEWIELYNTTDQDIDLAGWTLMSSDGTPTIHLTGTIPAHGYYLLERTDDDTVRDVPAGQIYTGDLLDGGEVLTLTDRTTVVVDTVNAESNGDSWPAGTNSPDCTMERIESTAPDTCTNWATNDGVIRNGLDADGGPISGTPKCRNSASSLAADLAVGFSGVPTSVDVGARLTYTLRFRNAGNVTATTTWLTNTLPTGLSFFAQTSSYTFSHPSLSTLVWQAGDLPISTTLSVITVTVDVDGDAAGMLTSIVTATTIVTDTPGANNTVCITTAVRGPPPQRADCVVAKSGPATVSTGDLITYRITLSNTGTAVATSTMLTDTLPAAVDFVTQTGPFTFLDAGNTLRWQVGEVLGGAHHVITVTGRVRDFASDSLTNHVTATTTASETVTDNNADSWLTAVVVTHDPLDVVINEVAWMGTDASWEHEWIELYNTTGGEIDLRGWALSDGNGTLAALTGMLPAGDYYLLARHVTTFSDTVLQVDQLFSGSLRNGGEAITLTDGSGVVLDTANVERGYDNGWAAGSNTVPKRTMERIDPSIPDADANWCTNDGVTRNGLDAGGNPINGTPEARNSCYRPPVSDVADLSVAKTGPLTTTPGSLITYTIALSNVGSVTASATLVTDALPAAVAFITQSTGLAFSRYDDDLVWLMGDVPIGVPHLITVTGRVTDIASGMFTNPVAATTTASETVLANNYAACQTQMKGPPLVYLPLILRAYTQPRYWVVVEAVLYDGLQLDDYDEAVLLLNGGDGDVDLSGWELCKWATSGWACTDLPAAVIAPCQRLWLARNGASFAGSFGFAPDYVLSGWPRLANTGDEVVLRDGGGVVRDALVYEGGTTSIAAWDGPAVQPYGGAGFAVEGQVLYRYPDEGTGLPPDDTDTAADWAQYADDPWHGRRVRYPGWDLEQFFQPALGTSGTVTVGIAPDNAYRVVVDAIRSAEESIELEVYTLEHYRLVTELTRRAQQGVSVTVLLEGGPAGGVEDQALWACQQLHATDRGRCYFMVTSDTLRIHDRYAFVHAKFMVVDRKRLLVASQNLTHHGLPGDDKRNGTGGSRGVVLATDAPGIVARAAQVFQADCDPAHHADIQLWGPDNELGYGPPPLDFTPDKGEDWVTYPVQFPHTLTTAGTWFELVTAPESALRSSDALLGLVARAGAGDAVCIEQLYEHADWGDPVHAPNPRLQAYVDAARRGARVRILLNGGDFDIGAFSPTENVEAAAYINDIAQAEGLDLSAHLGDPTRYGIHNKMVLVNLGGEGKYVHVGSINGSERSNKVNREMALHVRSEALFDYLYAMFQYDWLDEPPMPGDVRLP